ncbi:MAG: tRNA 2-thiouridine(34) synthase MnmA [Bacteroidales bacterium]|nr:tRNA 2-thiouridine(34) synthase MnmA [Bacteroidales bacterium]
MTIAALVSGGVDSTVAVHLLKEQGYTPDLFYIQIGSEDKEGFMDCPAEEDIELTQYTARRYGCRFEIIDLHREYWDNVVAYTIDTVRRGLTPNTDVMCNKLIKFGAFVERRGKDYDRIATGHYATMTDIGEVRYLSTAVDPVKDQTDFLSQLSYDQLRPLMFPIGNLMKEQVRTIAHEAALPSADRKDSQGICFLGKINYNDFLRRYLGEREGKIVELETGKTLGSHRGYWFHTIGQRKGLLLGGGPWFVVKKDIEENILYVSRGYDTEAQYGKEVDLLGFHFLSPTDLTNPHDGVLPIKFKIRHTPTFTDGLLTLHGDKAHIASHDKLQGIAPGQYATIYDSDAHLVLATGMIA